MKKILLGILEITQDTFLILVFVISPLLFCADLLGYRFTISVTTHEPQPELEVKQICHTK